MLRGMIVILGGLTLIGTLGAAATQITVSSGTIQGITQAANVPICQVVGGTAANQEPSSATQSSAPLLGVFPMERGERGLDGGTRSGAVSRPEGTSAFGPSSSTSDAAPDRADAFRSAAAARLTGSSEVESDPGGAGASGGNGQAASGGRIVCTRGGSSTAMPSRPAGASLPQRDDLSALGSDRPIATAAERLSGATATEPPAGTRTNAGIERPSGAWPQFPQR